MPIISLRPRLSPIWKNRDFRNYWLGEAVSGLGDSLTHFALPIVAAVTLRVTPGQMGLIHALSNVPNVAIGLLAGVWVDRVSRRQLLIWLNAAAAVLVASIPVAFVLGSLTVGHLYVLSLAFGIAWPFWYSAWAAFLPSVVERSQLVEANSKLMLIFSTTGITGPGIGGILIALMKAPFLLLIDAVSFVAAIAFLAAIRVPERSAEDAEEAASVFRRIVEGLRVTFVDPMQRAITVPRAILNLIDALVMTVIVLYILRDVGLSPQLMGLAFALSSVGFVAGSLISPRVERRLDIGGMIVLGLFLVAISPYTLVIASDSLPDAVNVLFFALPGFIGGTGGVIQYVGLTALRQSITPERVLGRVWASASVLGAVMSVIGALLGGFLGDTVGLRAAVVVSAIAYAVPFLYSLVSPLRHASRMVETGPAANETPA